MRVILIGFGTRGDVHPLFGLGQALQARGHEALLLTNPAHADEAARAGLPCRPIGDPADYEQTIAHPKMWHPIDGMGVMWRYLLRPALQPTFEALRALTSERQPDHGGRPLLVLASPLAMGARLAQEAFGIRLISTYTAATLLRSVADPALIVHWHVPRFVPRWARLGAWSLLDRAKLDPLFKPALQAVRARAGLRPLDARDGSIFGRWMHAPLGGLTLFPDWFAATAPDWPAHIHRGGFPLYGATRRTRIADAQPLCASLQEFLASGDPPVVFMPGSAQQNTAQFFRAAREAIAQLGLRAVMLGLDAGASGPDRAAMTWSAPYFPFELLLPHARALVHHGGIGTSAQALHAGIGQLVWPQAYDQFDNALRLEQLGVGRTLPPGPPSAADLAHQLGLLLVDPAVAKACDRWVRRIAGDSAMNDGCAWLESLP